MKFIIDVIGKVRYIDNGERRYRESRTAPILGIKKKRPSRKANAIKLRKSSKGIRSMIERRKQTPDRIYQKKGMTKRQIKELPEKVLTQGKNYDNL